MPFLVRTCERTATTSRSSRKVDTPCRWGMPGAVGQSRRSRLELEVCGHLGGTEWRARAGILGEACRPQARIPDPRPRAHHRRRRLLDSWRPYPVHRNQGLEQSTRVASQQASRKNFLAASGTAHIIRGHIGLTAFDGWAPILLASTFCPLRQGCARGSTPATAIRGACHSASTPNARHLIAIDQTVKRVLRPHLRAWAAVPESASGSPTPPAADDRRVSGDTTN